eukprot:78225-Hanusia_phi.AAC.1
MSWRLCYPSGRDSAAMASYGNLIFLFGGWSAANDGWSSDFYAFHTQDASWSKIETSNAGPSARYGHQMVTVRDALFLFGGDTLYRGAGLSDDLYLLPLANMHWTAVPKSEQTPSARLDHQIVAIGVKVYLFGGKADDGSASEHQHGRD